MLRPRDPRTPIRGFITPQMLSRVLVLALFGVALMTGFVFGHFVWP